MVRKISCFRVVRNSLPVPYIIKEPCNMKKVLNRIFINHMVHSNVFEKPFFLKWLKNHIKQYFSIKIIERINNKHFQNDLNHLSGFKNV